MAKNEIIKISFGILWLLFGLALWYYSWNWFKTIASFQGDDYFLAIYWIGYWVISTVVVLIPPFWLISQAMKRTDTNE